MRLREIISKSRRCNNMWASPWVQDKEGRDRLIGRQVKIQGQVRTIEATYGDIVGGVRLDKRVDGFFSWNLDDCQLLPIKRKR